MKYPPGINKMDDYIGRRVILNYSVTTNEGKTFPAGTAMYVAGHWRGRLTLQFGNKIAIRHVHRGRVRVF